MEQALPNPLAGENQNQNTEKKPMPYFVKKTQAPPKWTCDWNAWENAETATLENLMPESSDHRPRVACRLLHDDTNIYGIYQVQDRYVKVTHVGYQVSVCKDSCVEFFFKPSVGPGYFNLEMNAGGSFLFYYVRNHQRTETGFIDYSEVAPQFGKLITVKTTLPQTVDPEITTPVTWCAQFAIPMAAIEEYCGKVASLNGQQWTCNFYKCGDDTSHPHWLTWAPIPICNYHLPEAFDKMSFE